jgi:zinc D-Ala-D-Ala dipeptidase
MSLPAPSPHILASEIATHADFSRLADIQGLHIDLRYASTNNFAARNLYGETDCAWLHRIAAEGLQRSVNWLARAHPQHKLVVLDALRPQHVQEALWHLLADFAERDLYLAEPTRGSIHSFGMAVDVTLLDQNGIEIDMGTSFDALDTRSQPKYAQRFLNEGTLTAAHLANRALLVETMQQGGFRGISTEWWHFDCGDRNLVRATFARVL